MNPAPARENFPDGLQLQVASRRDGTGSFALVALGQIFLGGGEAVGNESAHAHARLRKTGGESISPVGLLHVFPEGEFDAGRSSLKNQLFRIGPVAEFDDAVLAADGISGAVEQVGD